MRHLVSSVVNALADAIEFTNAALAAAPNVQKQHLSKIIDQEEKMEMRVARALGVPYREFVEGELDSFYVEDAEREIARRRTERKRMIDRKARERAEALELREEAFA
ncbi:hypothetical protein [Methylobacterium sp. AMS5]|uniref:hypothetical protein n=1 Tax=Methylobacterium sp. AMS5 TaxID=925818 RepID=UPI00074F8D33|nr:hypothetical protein [Methylobacterium sp. AMS5]AMB48298.1 hypothetical protein Y590_25355 [Methylobacterium sp. AMS5]